jgi:hypothetical protein
MGQELLTSEGTFNCKYYVLVMWTEQQLKVWGKALYAFNWQIISLMNQNSKSQIFD